MHVPRLDPSLLIPRLVNRDSNSSFRDARDFLYAPATFSNWNLPQRGVNRAWPGTIVDYLSRKKERERGLYTWSEASFFRMKRNGEMKFCVFCDFQYGNLVHNINFLLRRSIREYFFSLNIFLSLRLNLIQTRSGFN